MCVAGDPRRRSSCRRSGSATHGSAAGRRFGSSPKRRRLACGGRWRRTSGSRSTWGCGTGIPTSAMRSSTSWRTDTGGRGGSCSRRTTRPCPWARTRRKCSRRLPGGSTRRRCGAGASPPTSSRAAAGAARARRTARGAARAHRVLERRSAPRRRPGGDRARYRGGARVDMTVAVVGAGLAGLSAAWELSRAGADVVVLDAGREPGGMIVTDRHDGFIVEGGPDGFLAAEPDIQELARQLGIEGRLVDQVARGSTLWTGRRLEPLAEGRAAELLGIQVNGNVGGFRTFATGMADVVEALVACLVPPPRLRTTQGVTAIAQAARGWRLSFTGGSSLDAEAVILAIPAWVAARLLAGLGVSAARALDTLLYPPSITVSLAHLPGHVAAPLGGAGFGAGPGSRRAQR